MRRQRRLRLLPRRRPGFRATYHGFPSSAQLLEEAQRRGLMRLVHDDRSGGYVIQLQSTP